MPKLKAVVDTLDSVPEPLRELYTKDNDGKFRLDSDHEDANGLRRNRDEVLREKRELAKKLEAFGELTPEEAQALLKERSEREENKAKAAGEFEKLKGQLIEKHEKEKDSLTKKIGRLTSGLEKMLKRDRARSALLAAEGDVDLMLPHVLDQLKVVEKGEDEYDVVVIDKQGQPRIANAKGEAMSIDQLVAEMKTDAKYGRGFKGGAASGSGAGDGGKGGGSGTGVFISRADAKNPAKYRAAKAEADKQHVELQYSD